MGRITLQRFCEKLAEGKKTATYSRLKLTERLELRIELSYREAGENRKAIF